MLKKLPKPLFVIIFLLSVLIIAGTSAYVIFQVLSPTTKSPETTQIAWFIEKMGEDKTGVPLMRVRVDFKGKTAQGYDVGTYYGDCFEIAKSKWELLENEISGVICGWSDWGDEVGLFKEGDKFVIKHGVLGSGRPATEDEPTLPHFRGDFKPLLEIKVEGWLPYEFGKTDYAFKKPFRLSYPPNARIVKSSEFSSSEYSPNPPDKLLFEVNNKKCWMIILPPGMGIEEPPADFSSEEKDVDIAGKKWGTLIWRVKDRVTFYGFYYKDDTNYSFSINPGDLTQCLDAYKQILSTFEFTEPSKVNSMVEETAKEIVSLLKDKNLVKLSTFVHSTKGVRFSPYTYVSVEKDQVFTKEQIKTLNQNPTEYNWGVYDGSGLPINLTFGEYYNKFIYDKDFAYSKQISVNRSIGQSNTINNIPEVYPRATYIEYYIPGGNKMAGMWGSLRLVFEEDGNQWFLVGIVHDQWTV